MVQKKQKINILNATNYDFKNTTIHGFDLPESKPRKNALSGQDNMLSYSKVILYSSGWWALSTKNQPKFIFKNHSWPLDSIGQA